MSALLERFNTIQARIIVGGGVLLAGLVPIALIGIAALGTIRSTVGTEFALLQRVTLLSSGIAGAVSDELRAAERHLTAPDSTSQQRFRTSAAAVLEHQQALAALPELAAEERVTITRIQTLQERVEVTYHYAHALSDLGRTSDATAAAMAAREPAEELVAAVRAVSAFEAARAETVSRRLVETAERRRTVVWAVLVTAVFVGGAIGVTLVRSIDRPLRRLLDAAQRFGEGDLRQASLGGAMPRELRALSDSMDRVGVRLRSIISETIQQSASVAGTATDLSAVSEQLAATAGEITTAMVEISGGAEGQVTGLEQSRTAMGVLGSGARANADVARRVSEFGAGIHRLAERHRADIGAAGESLKEVQAVVEHSATQAAELEELSATIDDFVDLIKRISSQTNLLALNAAIEAARAGEQGAGFAVVAEEVRQLADSSARAAEDVTETVQRIRSQTADVARTIGTGRAKVRRIGSVASGAAGALEEIVSAVAEVETVARNLAEDAKGHLSTAEEVSTTLKRVAESAAAHASSAQQVTAAAEQQGASTQEMAAQASTLTQAADRLRALVEGFTV